ncbi:DUF2625 domain-containing protein [Niabella sp. CC-SYL272]|uniref:DUF2625 domain-containing protein n=1 Tax=Niabella agricola TaxID=2891571 RepID=UPI001F45BD78|nr:DUF2625 domain-containing protein [Niabella agricola]MCF3112088.1 DUF2625 domain-containing protein [Niabella agricola]
MKPIKELINTSDPVWPLVQDWIKNAKNKVAVLPADIAQAKDALLKLQVTTRSPMGALVYETGGLLIDDGWIRILGSGNEKLDRSLSGWNKGKSFKDYGEPPAFLLIADDAIGGFFLLNGGALGKDAGKIYYFSPDNLEYEPLGIGYTDFLHFCFNSDLEKFYQGNRWTGWRREVAKLSGDNVFNFYPFLWTKEGRDINKNSRKIISIEEQYQLNIDFRKQLKLDQ